MNDYNYTRTNLLWLYLLYYRPDLFLLLSHRSPGCSGKPKQTNIYNNNNICGSWLQSLIWSIWKYVVLEIKSTDWPLFNLKLFVLKIIPTDWPLINLKIFCIVNYMKLYLASNRQVNLSSRWVEQPPGPLASTRDGNSSK